MNFRHLLVCCCLFVLFCNTKSFAQAPQQFNYQGAARNANGTPLANRNISLRISILDGASSGNAQYSETRNVTTNQLGLYSVAIGSPGASSTTGTISGVTWANGLKFIKVEVDPNNGNAFTVAGTAQLLSVPYAMYAATGGSAGSTILSGSTAPGSGTGSNGDFYIDNTTNIIYGPKANGSWPAGKSLVGPQGPAGPTGPNGKSISGIAIDGNGNMTITFNDGTTTTVTGSAKGPKGDPGNTGPAGATGPQGPAGANGANGRGISSATANGNGSVTFTYSDGTSFTSIPTTNVLSKSGTNLTSTVNGVASSTDLQSVIAAATTVSNTLSGANLSTTVNGVTGAAVNLQPALAAATTVSNTLNGTNLTTTVNGVTSNTVNLGNVLTSATTNSLTVNNGNLVATVNGVASSPTVAILTQASNGLMSNNGVVQLGGALNSSTTITTSATNTLAITGLQTGTGTDKVLTADANGVMRSVDFSSVNASSWNISGNAGTDGAVNFLGTTDAKPLIFKVQSTKAGYVSPTNSNVSLGFGAMGGYTDTDDQITYLNNPSIGGPIIQRKNKSVAIGYKAMAGTQNTVQDVAIGAFAMANGNTSGFVPRGVAIGYRSMLNVDGNILGNTAVGWNTLSNNKNGANNIAIGTGSLSEATTIVGLDIYSNIALGNVGLVSGMTQFNNNLILGHSSLTGTSLSTFNNNLILGNGLIGNGSIYTGNSLTNRLLIGNRTNESSNTPTHILIDGDFSSKFVTINNTLKVADLSSSATATTGNRPVVANANGQLMIGTAPAMITADNGLTKTADNIQLGGALTKPTILTTDATNTLALAGLQTGTTTDKIVTTDVNGVLKSVDRSTFDGDLRLVGNGNHITSDAGLGTNGTSVGSGGNNIAIGAEVLKSSTTGNFNTAIGYQSLSFNTTGQENTALGGAALFNNTTGNNNVAIGISSLDNNQAGNLNTAVGNEALSSVNGNSNTGVGQGAGKSLSGGNGNVFIGANTGFNTSTNASDQLFIGNATGDNALIRGDFAQGALTVNKAAGNTASSPNKNSTLNINGSFSASIVTINSDYTATDQDYTIVVKNQNNNMIYITLPTPSAVKGRLYNITTHPSTPTANFTLVGVTSLGGNGDATTNNSLTGYGKYQIQSTGTDWVILNAL